jgi:8-oxo-dGTP pyrophosphatase MutT (NUDIX family)
MNPIVFAALLQFITGFRGAGVQIMNGDTVLLVQNLGSGNWGFPKGHREAFDTSWRETAVREVQEETGLVEGDHYVICSDEPDLWGRRPYWTATAIEMGPLRINTSEHRAVEWVPVSMLSMYKKNYDLSDWNAQGSRVKCSTIILKQ